MHTITRPEIAVYRIRMSSPGHGRKIAEDLGAGIVVAGRDPGQAELVFNYGRGTTPAWGERVRWLNHPSLIANSADKLRCWELLDAAGVPRVEHTTSRTQAAVWLREDGKLYSRSTMRGRRGRGITVVRREDGLGSIPHGQTYVRAFPTAHEFRVHVFCNYLGEPQVIDLTQKKKRHTKNLRKRGLAEANMDVRNLAGGWIYARKNICPSRQVSEVGIAAVEACGLDFGGVDILMDARGNAVVCEVNSAPGLRGTTRAQYAQAILQYYEDLVS